MRIRTALASGIAIVAMVLGTASLAAPALAQAAVPGASVLAGTHKPHSIVGDVVTQVNPTTWTNELSKTLNKLPLIGAYQIGTRSGSPTLFVTSEGNGVDMQAHSTGYSTFNRSQPAGATGYVYTTSNGNYCVHGTNTNLVVGSTSCGANNTASQWFDTSMLQNVAYGCMEIPSRSGGEGVKMDNCVGDYYFQQSGT